MLFRKRKKWGAASGSPDGQSLLERMVTPRTLAVDNADFVQITYEMMKKGHIIKRGRQTFRQIGVTVNGSTRLVTSGDTVDNDTYEALLRAGIVSAVSGRTGVPAPEED